MGRSGREMDVDVKGTLRDDHVHKGWSESYRGAENERFDRISFDWQLRCLQLPAGAEVLDAGCGDARHSLRLARAGLRVTAVDFSDFAVQDAREQIEHAGQADRVSVQQADITALEFPDAQFDAVFCIGVLMHIPDMEAALTHMARVLRPGGFLVLSESSMHGFDVLLIRARHYLRPGADLRIERADGALHLWSRTETGPLLTRTHHIPRLVQRLVERNLTLVKRGSGEFTEFYHRLRPTWAQNAVHAFNRFWFRWVRIAPLATGQVLIFRKG